MHHKNWWEANVQVIKSDLTDIIIELAGGESSANNQSEDDNSAASASILRIPWQMLELKQPKIQIQLMVTKRITDGKDEERDKQRNSGRVGG